jgi:V/A-type H+-transporting ATPase subunit E
MNGIEKITAHIESDARQEAEAVRADTEKRCQEIRASYEKAAQEEYWKLVKSGVKDCELRVQRLGKTAAMESKKSLLALKQEMVSQAFERAKDLICALPESEYTDFLARMAASAAHTGMEEVILNERDKASCGKAVVKAANELLKARGLHGKLTLGEETRLITGGVIVREGDIEVNCSVEALIDQNKSNLALQVAEVMFAS